MARMGELANGLVTAGVEFLAKHRSCMDRTTEGVRRQIQTQKVILQHSFN